MTAPVLELRGRREALPRTAWTRCAASTSPSRDGRAGRRSSGPRAPGSRRCSTSWARSTARRRRVVRVAGVDTALARRPRPGRAPGAADRLRLPAVLPPRRNDRPRQRGRRAALHAARRRPSGGARPREALDRVGLDHRLDAPAGPALRRRAPARRDRPGLRRAARRSSSPTSRPATSTPVTGAGIVGLLRELNADGHDDRRDHPRPRDRRRAARGASRSGTARGRLDEPDGARRVLTSELAPSRLRSRRTSSASGRRTAHPPAAGGAVRPRHRDRHRRHGGRARHLGVEQGRPLLGRSTGSARTC